MSLIGPMGLLIILLFFTVGAVITRHVMAPVAALVAEQERREAEFRMAHVRVKERSEDILFSRGEDAEARQLGAELAAVLANQEKLVWRYLKLGITTKLFDYAGVAVNYLALAAPIFGIVGAGIAGGGVIPGGGGDSKDKGAVAQWISNASFAILQLIFGGSQIIDAARIISDSAGYTARVGELFEGLQLLPSPRLESHRVQTHGRDVPFPPSPPSAAAASASALASPPSKSRAIWERLSWKKGAGYSRKCGNAGVSEITGLLDVRVERGEGGSRTSPDTNEQNVQTDKEVTGYGTWKGGDAGGAGVSTWTGVGEWMRQGYDAQIAGGEQEKNTGCSQITPSVREFMLQGPTWLMVPRPQGTDGRAAEREIGWSCCHVSAPASVESARTGEEAGERQQGMHPLLQYSIHSVPPELRSLVAALVPQHRGRGEKGGRIGGVGNVSSGLGEGQKSKGGKSGGEALCVRLEEVRLEEVRVEDVKDVKIVVTFQCSDVPLWPIHSDSSAAAPASSLSAAAAASAPSPAASAGATPPAAPTAAPVSSARADASPPATNAAQADVSRAMNRLLFNFRLFQQQLCEQLWAAGHWADAVDPLTGYLMHAAAADSTAAYGNDSVGSGGARNGGATSGGATSGGATSGGATSGGATSGGATSGGATSGGATSGGAGSRWPFPTPVKYNEVDIAQILLGYPVAPTATTDWTATSTNETATSSAAVSGSASGGAVALVAALPPPPPPPLLPSCPLVLHPTFGTHTYPASLLTTAPLPLLQSAICHVAGTGWRLPGWQEEPGVLVVGQGMGDGGSFDSAPLPAKGAEGENRGEERDLEGFDSVLQPPCHTCSPSSFPPALSLSRLTLTLPHTNHLLVSNLSLHLPRGKALLVTGPSGCGKTSLLRAIAGLWPTSSRHVSSSSSSSSSIPSVAAVPPSPVSLFPPSAFPHVMFLSQKPLLAPSPCLAAQVMYPMHPGNCRGRECDDACCVHPGKCGERCAHDEMILCRVEAALAVVGLAHLLPRLLSAVSGGGGVESGEKHVENRVVLQEHHMRQQQQQQHSGCRDCPGSGTALEQLGNSQSWMAGLSPGEQQRLQFARVVFHRPRLVFLDEATSAVDAEMEARMYAWLARFGTAFVSVSHRKESLRRWHHAELVLLGNGLGRWRIVQ
ncbi:hypothetical protein CLOM_g14155 [Closterium sp. NIES-68]|nr:hypothetical protein CLOM_g14155 [Closterium sp. NIES-68]GJP80599.1 hypothetical protein CLOP_g10801 [Closterium sp. NIES-67]